MNSKNRNKLQKRKVKDKSSISCKRWLNAFQDLTNKGTLFLFCIKTVIYFHSTIRTFIWVENDVKHSRTFQANIYLFKVNKKNIRKRCEICSKSTILLCHFLSDFSGNTFPHIVINELFEWPLNHCEILSQKLQALNFLTKEFEHKFFSGNIKQYFRIAILKQLSIHIEIPQIISKVN